MASTVMNESSENQTLHKSERSALEALRAERRPAIRITRLHHNAIRTDDMEATRRFYEDILGLPLVHTMKMGFDATTGQPTLYLHCFFEMADGGMIALFPYSTPGQGANNAARCI
jgi:hypothetical protein